MKRLLIPASGSVQFSIRNPVGNLVIDGERLEFREWRRPVVGLLFEPPLKHIRHADGSSGFYYGREPLEAPTGIPFSKRELIVDEIGSVMTPEDYLSELMGERHWDHVDWLWQPHVSAPVTDGPRRVEVWETLEVCPCPTCEPPESQSN
jgi:hypothetical protein